MNFSKSGKTVDESRAWLKRIAVSWVILNGLDLISTSVLGALGCDMGTFLRYFPGTEQETRECILQEPLREPCNQMYYDLKTTRIRQDGVNRIKSDTKKKNGYYNGIKPGKGTGCRASGGMRGRGREQGRQYLRTYSSCMGEDFAACRKDGSAKRNGKGTNAEISCRMWQYSS